MKLTAKILKEMIRKELKEMNSDEMSHEVAKAYRELKDMGYPDLDLDPSDDVSWLSEPAYVKAMGIIEDELGLHDERPEPEEIDSDDYRIQQARDAAKIRQRRY